EVAAREARLAAELAAQRQATTEAQRAAEDARRAAAVETDRRAAEDSLRRAQEERARLEQDKKLLETERRAPQDARKAAAQRQPAATPSAPSTARDIANVQYDGSYEGQLCNHRRAEAETRCWRVMLAVHNGVAEASWPNRALGTTSTARGAIAANGVLEL